VVGDVPIITHDSPDRRSDNTKPSQKDSKKPSTSLNHEDQVSQGVVKKAKRATGEVSAFGTPGSVHGTASETSMASGLEYT
jgi:hypothetical protein